VIDPRVAHGVAERAARESYGKLLAYLAKRCGGVDAAEEALASAFAAALERWPIDGVPRAPDAWLLVTARNAFFDRARRERRAGLVHERLAEAARDAQRAFDASAELADERLGLMFACAHPALAADIRAPLVLQAVLGLDAARIASAFLVAPATMSQRLVRAKHKIAATRIPFRVPGPEEWPERLDAVLAAIYAAFGEGWSDPGSSDPRTRGLAIEAMWLGRLLSNACPNEPEVSGLLALMLYAHARRNARRDADGAYVPLEKQDVTRWDVPLIEEAEALLARAAASRRLGRFQLEAAIQSAHVARSRYEHAPDWTAIAALYAELLRRTGSPVVALNRAVALSRANGAQAGLEALAELDGDARLQSYQPYWATRADLLARAGEREAANAAYERALGLTVDPPVRRYLELRMAELGVQSAAGSPAAAGVAGGVHS
jgi:RNA polymerase sigma-70 factor, ECF subfamily